MEWAPGAGQDAVLQLTPVPVFRKKAHGEAPNPQHWIQATGGRGVPGRRDPAWALQRHDLSRNLIRIWVEKYQAGGLDEDAVAADLLQSYEARIAALERLVGKQALELEFGSVRGDGGKSVPVRV